MQSSCLLWKSLCGMWTEVLHGRPARVASQQQARQGPRRPGQISDVQLQLRRGAESESRQAAVADEQQEDRIGAGPGPHSPALDTGGRSLSDCQGQRL